MPHISHLTSHISQLNGMLMQHTLMFTAFSAAPIFDAKIAAASVFRLASVVYACDIWIAGSVTIYDKVSRAAVVEAVAVGVLLVLLLLLLLLVFIEEHAPVVGGGGVVAAAAVAAFCALITCVLVVLIKPPSFRNKLVTVVCSGVETSTSSLSVLQRDVMWRTTCNSRHTMAETNDNE
jgi:hypothetical protein